MRARHALSQDPKMISNAAGFPVPEKPFPVMSNSVPCYFQHLPCYGINRENQNIYLISDDKIRIFSGKSADNREEKNSFPVLSLFHAPEQGKSAPRSPGRLGPAAPQITYSTVAI